MNHKRFKSIKMFADRLLDRMGEDNAMKSVLRFFKNESGATAIEYSLIAALIAVVIITATAQLGTNISAKFQSIADNLT